MIKKVEFGLIGLGVMGQSLALNMARKKYTLAVFNRSSAKTIEFNNSLKSNQQITMTFSLDNFVEVLEKPRKIFLMVKDGEAVDDLVFKLLPLLDKGDTIVDLGNSFYKDTAKRVAFLDKHQIRFVGCGVSGGEYGALHGPSLMAGGNIEGYFEIEPILKKIAAKNGDKVPCCEYFGNLGAGHFIKMVHNGIEYALMQQIAEAYQLLRASGFSTENCGKIFADYNEGKLKSYLMEISAKILSFVDKSNGTLLIDSIADMANMKHSGLWALQSAFEYMVPFSNLSSAIGARLISQELESRVKFSHQYAHTHEDIFLEIDDIANGLYAAMLITFAQGFQLLKEAATANYWNYRLAKIANVWRNGCIIQGDIVEKIYKNLKFNDDEEVDNLLLLTPFVEELKYNLPYLRKCVVASINSALIIPSMASSITYFDQISSLKLPTNLIQAQRDFFGAHKYQRVDREQDEYFHTNWL